MNNKPRERHGRFPHSLRPLWPYTRPHLNFMKAWRSELISRFPDGIALLHARADFYGWGAFNFARFLPFRWCTIHELDPGSRRKVTRALVMQLRDRALPEEADPSIT